MLIMWMDIRASKEAVEIAATDDASLKYVGFGNVSPEWFPCKVLWLKRNELATYESASTIFEQTDWMAFRLTGERTLNIDTATIRWFYNSRENGFPKSLYASIGLNDVFERIPARIVKIGEVVGGLSKEMADLTGLRSGMPVAGGGGRRFHGRDRIERTAAG